MGKSTVSYWNVLAENNVHQWEPVEGAQGMIEQLTLAIDSRSGDYTRLTRFRAGANTKALGAKWHAYPEEIYIVSGRLFDEAFGIWLEAGHYASRPPGEVHGPFLCEEECLVLEISYPGQSDGTIRSGVER